MPFIYTPQELSSATPLQYYFANITEGGDNIIEPSKFSEHPSVKSITERKFLDSFTFNPVNSNYIRDILDCLNPRKAVGVDGISPCILRLSAPVLADEVTKLINYLICIVPGQLSGNVAI